MAIPFGVIGSVVAANAGPGLGDPFWNNVMLLANFTNGPANSTNIDATGLSASVTPSVPASFSLNTATPVTANHGQYITKANSTSGNYRIQLGDDTSWAGAFTIEFWMYATGYNGSNGGLMTKANSTNANTCPFQIYWIGDTLSFRTGYTSTYGEVTKVVTKSSMLNTWRHLAFTRDSAGWLRMFVDGVFQAKSTSANASPMYANSLPIFIFDWAGASSNGWYGSIDDFRITRDVCRYGADSNFDLPTEPYWHPEA